MEKVFKIYKSSAGSGKTFTLVKEFLSIALSTPDGNDYKNILAITFTNKAAKEMKERVLQYLDGLKQNKLSDKAIKTIHDKLCEELDIPSHELSARAGNCLSNILHNYTQFNISTIDKFLIGVVRTFSNDLFLNANFEVNLDDQWIFDQAIHELISRVGNDPALTNILTEYVEQKSDNDENWHIEDEINSYSKHLFSEDSMKFIQRLKKIDMASFVEFKKDLVKEIKTFENEFKTLGLEAYQHAKNIGFEHFKYKTTGIPSFFKKAMLLDFKKELPGSRPLSLHEASQFIDLKKFPELDSENNESLKYFEQIMDLYNRRYHQYKLNISIGKSLFSLALLKEIEQIIEQIKEENNFIHISEFNKKIFDIVSNEPIPFIYERYGNKFKHLMIDEFQDTSILQWQNLIPLVENSLAQGFKNLVVGDAKQAIYRWRGGDVDQFVSLPYINDKSLLSDAQEKENTLVRNENSINLKENYRSSMSVINFNNDFFEKSINIIGGSIKDIYKDHDQNVVSKNEGYVSLELLDVKKEELNDTVCVRTFEHINDCLSRNYQYKDIALLVRGHSHAFTLTEYLSKQGVPIVSNESFLLEKNKTISLIIQCLYYTQSPSQIQHSLKVVDHIYELNLKPISSIYEIHKQLVSGEKLEDMLKGLGFGFNLNKLFSLSLYEKVEYLIDVFGLNINNAYVLQLLDIVHQYSNRQLNYLSDFLVWWEEKKNSLSISIPEDLNAVQILTIHKSKGLEYPIVMIPFCIGKEHKESLWIENQNAPIPYSLIKTDKSLENTDHRDNYLEENNKQQLDILNVMYVAFTRAVDELYIISKNVKDRSNLYLEEHLLKTYIQGTESEGLFHEMGNKKTLKKKIIEHIPSSEAIHNYHDWREHLEIAYHDPSLIDSEEEFKSQHERSFGIQVHIVLSKLSQLKDLDKVIKYCIQNSLINPAISSDIKSEIEQIFTIEGIEKFFSEEVISLNEREIISPDGKSFRPDKITIQDNLWSVIDYKTGEKSNKHIQQLRGYVNILEEMGKVVDGYILYTKSQELIKVN